MASDPAIRQAMLEQLQAYGGVMSASSYGELAECLAPAGVSMSSAKAALNSLAYTTARPRQATISRKYVGRSTIGDVHVSLLR
jgi:hypothetical protein